MGFFILGAFLLVILIVSLYVTTRYNYNAYAVVFGVIFGVTSGVGSIVTLALSADSASTQAKYEYFLETYNRAEALAKVADPTFKQKVLISEEIDKVNNRIQHEIDFCQKNDFWYGLFKNYQIAALEPIEYSFE